MPLGKFHLRIDAVCLAIRAGCSGAVVWDFSALPGGWEGGSEG